MSAERLGPETLFSVVLVDRAGLDSSPRWNWRKSARAVRAAMTAKVRTGAEPTDRTMCLN